jgi:hypothetical protein
MVVLHEGRVLVHGVPLLLHEAPVGLRGRAPMLHDGRGMLPDSRHERPVLDANDVLLAIDPFAYHPGVDSGSIEDVRAELSKAQKERDFYRKLVELGAEDALDPLLDEALALIVDVAGARRGYIEIRPDRAAGEAPRWWIARGCSDEDVAVIRSSLSQGVIAEAIATGRTIVTASALDDPRFKARGSVRRNRIEARSARPRPPSGPATSGSSRTGCARRRCERTTRARW